MREFQASQRQLEYLEKKHQNDQEMLDKLKADHAMKNGMTMLGGCLPMFAQIPFFFGLQGALNNSLELYQQPFIWWMQDLSLPDAYYILPLLIAISMFLSMTSASPKKGIRAMFGPLAMSLFMAAIFSIASSGLALYMFFNNFLHFIQVRIQKAFGL